MVKSLHHRRFLLPVLCVAFTTLLTDASASAQSASAGLKSWSQKVLREKEAEINKILGRKVVIIHRLAAKKKPLMARLPYTKPGAPAVDGYFYAPHSLEFDAAFGLNYPYQKRWDITEKAWLKLVRGYLAPGMLIVNEGKGKNWKMLQGESLDDELLEGKAPTASRKVSFKKLRQFLVKLYGFEGIVIDRRGNQLLALVLPPVIKKGSQATLIKDSQDKLTISKRDKRVDGILQLREFSQALSTATFTMVFRKKSAPIPFGTKLFIQKR